MAAGDIFGSMNWGIKYSSLESNIFSSISHQYYDHDYYSRSLSLTAYTTHTLFEKWMAKKSWAIDKNLGSDRSLQVQP